MTPYGRTDSILPNVNYLYAKGLRDIVVLINVNLPGTFTLLQTL